MTEPGAGSDLRGMKCKAVRDGGYWTINGEKHFISQAFISDFCVLFAATGEEKTNKGIKKLISAVCFLCFLISVLVSVAGIVWYVWRDKK